MFIPLVKRILLEHALAPSYLELEVTESSFGVGASVKCTLANARKVRNAGLTLAIDGFNAADVDLRLLTILPISKLRVDPMAVMRLNDGGRTACCSMRSSAAARSLGVAVCVTGVCNPELLAAILRHDRPLAQGSEVGKLRDAAEMLELLRGDGNDTAEVAAAVARGRGIWNERDCNGMRSHRAGRGARLASACSCDLGQSRCAHAPAGRSISRRIPLDAFFAMNALDSGYANADRACQTITETPTPFISNREAITSSVGCIDRAASQAAI